jgi:hypothetical protein
VGGGIPAALVARRCSICGLGSNHCYWVVEWLIEEY